MAHRSLRDWMEGGTGERSIEEQACIGNKRRTNQIRRTRNKQNNQLNREECLTPGHTISDKNHHTDRQI